MIPDLLNRFSELFENSKQLKPVRRYHYKTTTELFSDEEQAFIETLQEALKPLEGIASNKQEEQLIELSDRLQEIACYRYFNGLTYHKLLKDTQAITDKFDVILEDNTESIITIICIVELKYFTLAAQSIRVLEGLTQDTIKQTIKESVEEYFKLYFDWLDEHDKPKQDLNKDINDTVEKILNSISREKKKEAPTGLAVSKKVTDVITPTSSIINHLGKGYTLDQRQRVYAMTTRGSGKVESKKIDMFYTVTSNSIRGIEERIELNELAIMTAIYNLYRAENVYATNAMIKRACGLTNGLTPKQDEGFTNAIKKMNDRDIYIDQKEYAEAKGLAHDAFEGKILHLSKAYNVNLDGNIVPWCWFIHEAPVVIEHAVTLGQFISLPANKKNLIGCKYIGLQDYLIREAHRVKSKNQTPITLLDSVYSQILRSDELTGKNAARTKKRLREEIAIVMENLKKQGLIDNWRFRYIDSKKNESGKDCERKSDAIRWII